MHSRVIPATGNGNPAASRSEYGSAPAASRSECGTCIRCTKRTLFVSHVSRICRPDEVFLNEIRVLSEFTSGMRNHGRARVPGSRGESGLLSRQLVMQSFSGNIRVFVCSQRTDMRGSFGGLCEMVEQIIQPDPLSGHLFCVSESYS